MKKLIIALLGLMFVATALTGCPTTTADDDSADDDSAT